MKILSLQDTADWLNLSLDTIKSHIYRTKRIAHLVQYLGRSPGFTEDALPEIKRIILSEAPQVGRGNATKAEVDSRRDKAVDLRKQGLSWSQIAAQVGFKDASGAQKAVTRALAKKKPAKKTTKKR